MPGPLADSAPGAPPAETPYARAYRILQAHATRIGREDWEFQGCPVPSYRTTRKNGRTVRTERPESRRFIPSATLETLVEMMGDESMTPERALAFLHAPESSAWDTAGRNRNLARP